MWLPGDKAAYSDIGFILLGYALEYATGKPYETIVKEKILDPLHLRDTQFELPPTSKAIIPDGQSFFDLEFGYYRA